MNQRVENIISVKFHCLLYTNILWIEDADKEQKK